MQTSEAFRVHVQHCLDKYRLASQTRVKLIDVAKLVNSLCEDDDTSARQQKHNIMRMMQFPTGTTDMAPEQVGEVINSYCHSNLTVADIWPTTPSVIVAASGEKGKSWGRKRKLQQSDEVTRDGCDTLCASTPGTPSVSERLGELASLTEEELKLAIVCRDDQLAQLHGTLVSERKSKSYWQRKCDELRTQLVQRKEELQQLQQLTTFRHHRNVTTYGGYSLASRRNIAHAGRESTAEMVTSDMGGRAVTDPKTISLFEHRLAAAKTVRSKDVYAQASVTSLFEVHGYAADATHHEAIERNKVHVSSISSIMASAQAVNDTTASDARLHFFDVDYFESACESMSMFGDLQVVEHANLSLTLGS